MAESTSLVSIKDIMGFSGPASALIEKVSGAVGAIFEPHQIRRVARAKADAALIEAQNEIQITDLHRRAVCRWLEEEAQKQKNIEDITMQAIPHLIEDADAGKIDDDWITNFFDKARIISDADMQKLWSRLLAEEANQPGYHSKRAVNILGDMDKNDAEIFMRLCCFGCTIGNFMTLIFNTNAQIYLSNGINVENLSHLAAIGLIQFNGIAAFARRGIPKKFTIYYHGKQLNLIMKKDDDNSLSVGNAMLTKSGEELASICGGHPIDGFLEYIKDIWSAQSKSPIYPPSDIESLA